MPWLKFDDAAGLEHRKTRRLLRKRGLEAFGLHMLALLHCSRYLTDGFVDEEFVDEAMEAARVRDKDQPSITAALVSSGQWTACEGGWTINGYLEHNPSRVDVEARRAKDAERKASGRRGGVPAESERSPSGLHAESERPVPSRPVPHPTQTQVATPTENVADVVALPGREIA
jgi:hypothetical protein